MGANFAAAKVASTPLVAVAQNQRDSPPTKMFLKFFLFFLESGGPVWPFQVRFPPKSGLLQRTTPGPLCAHTGPPTSRSVVCDGRGGMVVMKIAIGICVVLADPGGVSAVSARKRRRPWLSIASLLVALVAPGCQAAEPGPDRDFLRMPMQERDAAIRKYPPERQVDLYLMVMLEQHPPDLGLADAVASSGSRIVPALAKRLAQDNRDIAKLHLIDVFLRMQELGSYPVASDAKTMVLLDKQVAAMKDPQWKAMSSKMLGRIQRKSR